MAIRYLPLLAALFVTNTPLLFAKIITERDPVTGVIQMRSVPDENEAPATDHKTHGQTKSVKVSAAEPLVVETPAGWLVEGNTAPSPRFPFATCRIVAASGRNAVCMISVLDKDRSEFKNAEVLKRILRGDCRPYLSTPEDLAKLEPKELTISDGFGFYANFIDPALINKPVTKGSYKTASPIILGIGSKYLIKVTILCDDLNGRDYLEAMGIVKSIQVTRPGSE